MYEVPIRDSSHFKFPRYCSGAGEYSNRSERSRPGKSGKYFFVDRRGIRR
jgi:hypothetical protein